MNIPPEDEEDEEELELDELELDEDEDEDDRVLVLNFTTEREWAALNEALEEEELELDAE